MNEIEVVSLPGISFDEIKLRMLTRIGAFRKALGLELRDCDYYPIQQTFAGRRWLESFELRMPYALAWRLAEAYHVECMRRIPKLRAGNFDFFGVVLVQIPKADFDNELVTCICDCTHYVEHRLLPEEFSWAKYTTLTSQQQLEVYGRLL